MQDDLLKTRMHDLLTCSCSISNQEMQKAYVEFTEEVENRSKSEKDYSIVFRALNLTRIEFASLEMLYQYGQGEKCTSKNLL